MGEFERMTTLFEDAENASPTSPALELLETPLKNEIESKPAVRSGDVDNGNQGNSATQNIDDNGTFSQFSGSDAGEIPGEVRVGEIPSEVRVVHVQVPDANEQQQANPTAQTNSPSPAIYAVGTGGEIQQVITPSDSNQALTAVTVDGASQDPARYTYYPAVQAGENSQGGGQQFYVMMSPQDVIPVTGGNTGPRIIAPRAQNLTQIGDCTFAVETTEEPPTVQFRKVEAAPTRSSRDERRRATHNEVERRRRDKINTWIMKLAAVVPDCQMDQSKQGTSKGGVLSKSLDHIIKLRAQNDRMAETIKEQERILVENQVLRQQVEKLRHENAILQNQNLQLRQSSEAMDEDTKPVVSDE